MATYTWLASGSGDFTVASNWTLDGINPATTAPGPNDVADFNGAITGTISDNPDVVRILVNQLNNTAPDLTFTGQSQIAAIDIDGKVTLTSGASITASLGAGIAPDANVSATFIIGPGASYHGIAGAQTANFLFNIGNGAGSTGTVIVHGPGALVDTGFNGASIAIQAATGTGSLQISDGGVAKFATSNVGQLVSLAVGRSGTGAVAVDGAGSELQLSGAMYAGRGVTGNGTVTLTHGASLTETAVGVGFATRFGSGGNVNGVLSAAGTGTLNVLSHSTATFGDSLSFGDNGATGMGLVSDATLNVGGLLRVGSGTAAPGGKGTLTINDGGVVHDTASADTSTAYVLLGAAAGTTGTVAVDGWRSTLDANAIDVGAVGTGTLTASDHGLVRSTGLIVGDRGNGTLSLTEGADEIARPTRETGLHWQSAPRRAAWDRSTSPAKDRP
jgi:autotransporter family porin